MWRFIVAAGNAAIWIVLGMLIAALTSSKAAADTEQRLHCLTHVIYWEARGQPQPTQVAVAQVVMNRAIDGRFPSDICGVIYQRNAGRCQFSWVCTHRGRYPMRDLDALKAAREAAELALEEHKDLTRGALFFHDTSIRGWPHLRRTVRLGDLVFYKER